MEINMNTCLPWCNPHQTESIYNMLWYSMPAIRENACSIMRSCVFSFIPPVKFEKWIPQRKRNCYDNSALFLKESRLR